MAARKPRIEFVLIQAERMIALACAACGKCQVLQAYRVNDVLQWRPGALEGKGDGFPTRLIGE